MAKFIAISGPSSCGKTSLINELSQFPEMSDVVFLPDVFETVWNTLVDGKYFSEYDEINRDPEYLCVFIQRLIDRYKELLDSYKDQEKVVIMENSWLDISIYSIVNMWYIHILKDVQESLLKQLSARISDINRLYITVNDESKQANDKYRSPFRRYNLKYNRPLEIQYYELSSHLKHAEKLPSSDITECAMFIIEDLKELGYLV